MRNALLVTYYFPPAGGPGVQYPAKHAKFLRAAGYNPIVLTVIPEDYLRHSGLETPLDNSRTHDLPRDLEIHRTRSHQPFKVFARLARWRLDSAREFFFLPDAAITWVPPAVRRAHRIARENTIDLVYTVVPPYSSAFIGWLLKRTLGTPWVLDFRDPWTHYFLAAFPTRLHYEAERALERSCLRSADHIVMPTPTARSNLLARCDFLPENKVTWLPMGYDAEDFSELQVSDETVSQFELVYSGVFCGAPTAPSARKADTLERFVRRLRKSLAYAPRKFDRVAHSPKFLLDAMRDLSVERPDLASKIKLIHIGPDNRESQDYARELGLGKAMESRGYISHAGALRLIQQANALFFCLADSQDGERNDCVPQKVYQYIASRRPILALCPEGDARDFIERSRTAIVCDPRDVKAIKAALLALVEGKLQFSPDESFIQEFECRTLAARLAGIFDRVITEHQTERGRSKCSKPEERAVKENA